MCLCKADLCKSKRYSDIMLCCSLDHPDAQKGVDAAVCSEHLFLFLVLNVCLLLFLLVMLEHFSSCVCVQAAVGAWGQRGLLELEAEERLAVACEKSPTQDPVIAQLRQAFNVSFHCIF